MTPATSGGGDTTCSTRERRRTRRRTVVCGAAVASLGGVVALLLVQQIRTSIWFDATTTLHREATTTIAWLPSWRSNDLVVDESNVAMPSGEPRQRHDRPAQVLRLSELRSRVPLTLLNQPSTRSRCLSMEDTTNNNMTTTTTAATVTTTLVTHMSADRGVWLVGEYCRRWHPHTMPVQRPSIVLVVSFESEAAYAQRAPAWDACPHMEVVAVVNDGIARNGTSGYPVNLLRNLVLARVRTSHVLVLDADFLPSVALADDIRDALQVRAAQPRDGSPEALVVPVFAYDVADPVARQVFWDDPSHQASRLPGTFDELLNCTQERVPSCTVFHATQFPPGHSTTQTERWLARDWDEPSRHGRDIRHIHCLKSTAWEPYVVVPWCSNAGTVTPFFDERFQNYGFNKIQWINHIRLLGFRFFVLPQGFAIHVPHPPTAMARQYAVAESAARQQAAEVYNLFRQELLQRHKKRFAKLKLCPPKDRTPPVPS